MIRQWQETFYEKNYECSPIFSPDFVKLAEAFGIRAAAVRTRSEVMKVVEEARTHKGPFLINFLVEQEDTVYPMIVPGAALHEMIRRPWGTPLSKLLRTCRALFEGYGPQPVVTSLESVRL